MEQELLTLPDHMSSLQFLSTCLSSGSCCSWFQLTCLHALVPCYDVRCDIRLKTMSSSSLHPCFVRGSLFYLCYMYLFTYYGVQHEFYMILYSFLLILPEHPTPPRFLVRFELRNIYCKVL
jgi:hypothetical protein